MRLIVSVFLLMVLVCMFGCTNAKDANRALNAEGFTNIEVTGYNFLACSQDDFYHTGFIATNSQGNRIKGTVCSGIFFKNATIRY